MSEHYYSSNPSVTSNPKSWRFELKGHNLLFKSDNGVFSKGEVDFGSRLLIESFAEPEAEGDFLDLGCGYGPIGLALAKAFPSRNVVMADINARAVELAKENAQANNISNVGILESNLFEEIERRPYSAILSNPPIRAGKETVHKIFEESHDYLADGGELWIVIQKKQGAPSALEKLKSIFAEVETVKKSKGYYIIKSKKG